MYVYTAITVVQQQYTHMHTAHHRRILGSEVLAMEITC